MTESWELINEKKKGKLSKCWLAATLSSKAFHRKFRKSTINDINLSQMCDDIEDVIEGRNNGAIGKSNLYLSSQLAYGAVKIFSYQTANLEKELMDIEKLLANCEVNERDEETHEKVIDPLDMLSTHSAQLFEDVNLLPDETDIEIKLRTKMNDAACLEFGALTEEEMTTSLEMFGRTNIRSPNVFNEMDLSFESEKTLAGIQELTIDMSEKQRRMSISPLQDNLPAGDEEHQISFSKKELLEESILGMEPRKGDLLTPQKRQSKQEKNIETPTKKRRDQPDVDKIVTEPIPEPVAVTTSVTEHPLELSHDVELPQKDSLEIEKKVRKKKVFADKNTQLSHKAIKTWLSNVNVCTMPLNIPNVNMPMPDILFKTPSTNFTFVPQRKWNNSLSALFHMHTIASSGRKMIPMEYRELLDKSTDFTRFEDKSDKTEGISSFVSVLGKTVESSVHTKSATELEHFSILQKEWYREKPIHDSQQEVMPPDTVAEADLQNLEETLELLNIEQPTHRDSKTLEKAKEDNQEDWDLYQSCQLTKLELLALFEVHWRNKEIVKFTDVIEPDDYDTTDAACCYILLLELHQEKKVTLEQATPYDTLWVRKYSRDVSESDSMP